MLIWESAGDRHRSNYVDSTCIGRRSIDDLGQFITLSVHFRVQHDEREAARRSGPSVTVNRQMILDVDCVLYVARRL